MILLLAMALSVVVALLRGGSFVHLARVPFRYGWLAILTLFMQSIVIYFPEAKMGQMWSWKSLLMPVSYSIILLVSILNTRLPGIPLIILGLALNILVISVNGGFMPVTIEALQRAGLGHMALGIENGARVMASKDIILSREATRLWLLSDVLVLNSPFPLATVFSVGDVLLMLGFFVLLQRTMCPSTLRSTVAL
jgi:hypothetical protein